MATAPSTDEQQEQQAPRDATLCEAFHRAWQLDPDAPALRTAGDPTVLTWADFAERVRAVAAGLAAHGVERGGTVAIMLANRVEAHVVDMAAVHLGATPFSVYNTSTTEQIAYLFENAACRVVVTEQLFLDRVRAAQGSAPALQHIFTVDGPAPDAPRLEDLMSAGAPEFDFEATWRAVEPDDVAVLIYTSGTTGHPKGVELTHRNVMWEIGTLLDVMDLPPQPRLISYLPMAHLADRIGSHYSAILGAGSITCVADAQRAAAALVEVRPTMWVGVPRTWEKLKVALETGFAGEPDADARHAVTEAISASIERVRLEQTGRPVPVELAARCEAAAPVHAAIRERIGLDQARFLITGAAPIPPEVIEFFTALGLPIHEVWGLSECTAIATINRPDANRIGTVGQPVPGSEVRLAADGELLIRGSNVMRGYRGRVQATAEAIDPDGWLHSGDVGEIDADGFVKIVDRKKELIIGSGGKNMSPANIESAIKAACPLIGCVVAIGDRRPYNTALLVLDQVAAAALAAGAGQDDTSPAALAACPAVQQAAADGIAAGNERLSRVEQIKRYTILPVEWHPGGDELTPTSKLRRKVIAEKYADLINAMYIDMAAEAGER